MSIRCKTVLLLLACALFIPVAGSADDNVAADFDLPAETQWNHFSPELIPDFTIPTRYDAVLGANAPVKWFIWQQAGGRSMFRSVTNGTDIQKFTSERTAMLAKGITAMVDYTCRGDDIAAMSPLTQITVSPGIANDAAITNNWATWTNWWQQIVVTGANGDGIPPQNGKYGIFMMYPDYEGSYGGNTQDGANHLIAGNYSMLEKSSGYVGQNYLSPLETFGYINPIIYSGGQKTLAWFNPTDNNAPAAYRGVKNEGNARIVASMAIDHYFETWLPEDTQVKDAASNNLFTLTHFGANPRAEHWAARVGGFTEVCNQYVRSAGQKLIVQLKLCADRGDGWQYDWSWNSELLRHRVTHQGPNNTETTSAIGAEMMPGFVAEAQTTLAYFSGADGINFWGTAYWGDFQPRPKQGNPQRGEKYNDASYGNVDRESYNNVMKALWRMNQKVTLEDGRQFSFFDICDGSEEYLTTNTIVSYDSGLTFKGMRAYDWQLEKKTAVRAVVNRNKNVIFILAFQPYGVEQNQVTVSYTDHGASFTKTISVPTNTLVLCAYQLAAETLVHSGASWKYLATNAPPASSWKNTNFPDTNWPSGPAPLGYGSDTDLVTVVSYGPLSTNKYPTTYFRRTFTASHVKALLSLNLYAKVDDGMVIYLNGLEVGRTNMPAGTITYTNQASGNASNPPRPWQTFNINPSNVIEGTNTLAVEVHQSGPSSSDIYFDLQLQPESVFDWPIPVTVTPLHSIQTSAAPWTVSALTTNSIQVSSMQLRWGQNGGVWTNVTMTGTGGMYSASITPASLIEGDTFSYEIHTLSLLGVETVNGPYTVLYTVPPGPEFIAPESTWRYRATNAAPASTWNTVGFNDSSWSAGTAPLGYGMIGEASSLTGGSNPTNRYPTYYFRKDFTLDMATAVKSLTSYCRADEGLVMYLNGHELGRVNMPTGNITYTTFASAASADRSIPWLPITVDPTFLENGTNTLAVELHQASPGNGNALFDFVLYPSSSQPVINHSALPVIITAAAPWSVSAVVQSYMPLASVQLAWSQNDGTWTTVPMSRTGGTWTAMISPSTLDDHDSIQYRIQATDTLGSATTHGPDIFMYSLQHGMPLVAQGTTWDYLASGAAPPGNWMAPDFAAAGWVAGPAPLGYSANASEAVATTLDYGQDVSNKYPTYYFRQAFMAGNVLAVGSLKAYLRVDDGAVIYINGMEAARTNMGSGSITYTNLATSGAPNPPRPWQILDIPRERLLDGTNWIAVELHQASLSSSDIFFDLALQPESVTNAPTEWCAYNDMAWFAGQPTNAITLYTPTGPASGLLTDYGTGAALPVTATISSITNTIAVYSNSYLPPAGSDAQRLFGSAVDCSSYVRLDTNSMVLRIGNLHPALRYSVVLFGSRGLDSNTYTQRWTTVSITSAVSYLNHSSTNSTVSTQSQFADTTKILTANMDGSVFRYDNIDPGMDGKIYLRITPGGAGSTNTYLSSFQIRTYSVASDSDGDGIPDNWEQAYFGGTTNGSVDGDADGDQVSNMNEYLAGTDPNDPGSTPEINIKAGTNRQVTLSMQMASNRVYAVYTTTNLTTASWTLVTNLVGHGTAMSLIPTNAIGAKPRYYKVKIRYPQ